MNSQQGNSCPVCEHPKARSQNIFERESKAIDCDACGKFELPLEAETLILRHVHNPKERSLISHYIRRMQRTNTLPVVTMDLLEELLKDPQLPGVREQADNLILWLGDQLKDDRAGQVELYPLAGQAIIGALDVMGYYYVVKKLFLDEFLRIDDHPFKPKVDSHVTFPLSLESKIGLTFEGWDRYEELQRSGSDGFIAFMAMPFKNPQVQKMYEECFRPAVARAGFDLRTVLDVPESGLIDLQIVRDIRRSRFIVADLTEKNLNVVWEAGLAEGMEKPVIYTCQKDVFAKVQELLFDVNHRRTVLWQEGKMNEAASQLKLIIRATIPEARQSED